MNLDLNYYFAVFLRRIHYFIIITGIVSAIALAAAFLLPPTYKAQAVLLVESSQIPSALSPPTVQAAAMEQLQIIQQRLMTRSNLLDIAKSLKAVKDVEKLSPDDIVQAMRDQTSITNKSGKEQATLMTISFQAASGGVAAEVVNRYVTLILQENVSIRTSRAEDTLAFFETEVKNLGVELDALSAKMLDFKNKNSDALPDTLSFRLSQQSMLQDRLANEERNVTALKEQKARLIAIFNSTGQVDATNAQQTPEARQLATLQTQLTQALAVLSPDNPKVRMLQAQIAQQEAIVKAQVPVLPPADGAGGTGQPASMLDVQLVDLDTRIKQSEDTIKQINEQLKTLTDTIDRTPANQIALDALTRDYQNVQQQYNTAVARLSQAAAGERIEVLSKGEKIAVIDAATVPDRPEKPNRVLIAIGGIVSGMALGLGTIVLLELLNRSVRRPKDLVKAFGITPIATVPYMRTAHETMARRSIFLGLFLLSVVGIPALIYAVHAYYLPLDIILTKIAAKVGIRL